MELEQPPEQPPEPKPPKPPPPVTYCPPGYADGYVPQATARPRRFSVSDL